MRYAVVSDLHANLEALTAVFARIDGLSIDRLLCLGDVVGYHADHDACVRMIRERGAVCIRGNHDRAAIGAIEPYDFGRLGKHAVLWTRGTLSAESKEFLGSLPASIATDDCVLTHAGLYPVPNDKTRIGSAEAARRHLDALANERYPSRVCFFGHTHKALAYERSEGVTLKRSPSVLTIDPGAYYLVNPGTVGQPRDDDKDASFCVYDTGAKTITWHLVPFDFEATLAKARAAGSIVDAAALDVKARPSERLMKLARRAERVARAAIDEVRGKIKK